MLELINLGIGGFGMYLMYKLADKHLIKIYNKTHAVEKALLKFISEKKK